MNSANKLNIIVDGKIATTEIIKRCFGSSVSIDDQIFLVNEIAASDFFCAEQNFLKSDINFMVRLAGPEVFSGLVGLIEDEKPYAYLIDDNFWLLLGESPLDKFYQHPMVRRSLELAVAKASIVFCHSEKFKNFLLNYNNNVKVLPTFFDFSCLENINRVQHDEIRIGVVGNSSRSADIEILVPAILSILRDAPSNLFFEFFGYTPPALVGRTNVRSLSPISDYREFLQAKYTRGWLLGLAPLIETRFSSYKTNNKFREFSGCEVAAIYSDVSIYREDVIEGENGWIVENTSEAWEKKIRSVLLNQALTRQVAENAKKIAIEKYSLSNVRASWVTEIGGLHRIRPRKSILNILKKKVKFLIRDNNFLLNPYLTDKKNISNLFDNKNNLKKILSSIVLVRSRDSVSTEFVAPVEGEFFLSSVIATFCKNPIGKVIIELSSSGREFMNFSFDDDSIKDGEKISFKSFFDSADTVKIKLINDTDLDIGVYILSSTGSTVCTSTSVEFPGRFVV